VLDKMYSLAEREGVAIEVWPLEFPVLGLYYSDPSLDRPVIAISQHIINQSYILRSVLAEELGHHFTSAGVCFTPTCYPCYHHRFKVTRAEERAMRWAALYLMPGRMLAEALSSGITEAHDLAEHFEVTEGLARFRLELSRKTGEILWGSREIA